jgi:hypothetical protein
LKSKGKVNAFVDAITERDISTKGYLPRIAIEDVFKKNGYTFNQKQFNIMFSAIDTNTAGSEYNYKQLFEILFGESEAHKIFSNAGGMARSVT